MKRLPTHLEPGHGPTLLRATVAAAAGFCYTQFTDTYQEANGLLYADRTPKAPTEAIARATSGLLPDFDPQSQALWREQILKR